MPYNRQPPGQILQSIQTELDDALEGADARLRRSVENVLSKVIVMATYDMYGFINWVFDQIHPLSADGDYLEQKHAALRNMSRKAATAAIGQVTFTGTNDTVIPAATVLRRTDGQEYTVDADVVIAAGSAVANVTAVTPGAHGNAAAAVKLAMATPVVGVQSNATVTAGGLYSGTDLEDIEDLRKRVLQVWQKPAQGGADHDYERWALEVAGVTRAWVYRGQMGYGTVMVIFVMDNKTDTIIPTPEEAELVHDYIDVRRTATAKGLYVIAPTPVSVDLTIQINPNTPAVQAAITAELKDFFKRESEPGTTLFKSRINEAISAAAGEFDHVLVTPAANVARAFGEMSMLGEITFEAIA